MCLADADTYKVKTTPIPFKEALKTHKPHTHQCCINTIAISVVFQALQILALDVSRSMHCN